MIENNFNEAEVHEFRIPVPERLARIGRRAVRQAVRLGEAVMDVVRDPRDTNEPPKPSNVVELPQPAHETKQPKSDSQWGYDPVDGLPKHVQIVETPDTPDREPGEIFDFPADED